MKIKKTYIFLLITFTLTLFFNKIQACSMYKITANGKTVVGCNHDAWLITSKIWFENATHQTEYGAGFTGARQVSNNRTAPQSGMNTAGLAFSRLASYHPKQNNSFTDRLEISDEVDYLTDILHKCANVKEVKKYIEQYNHSMFINDIFIYIDSSGAYLIVEPYQLIEGNNTNYVLANFCPSITSNEQARKLHRYRNGVDFLNTNKINSSLNYCTALSDTMSVCRSRNGDGTLLTSIWNTKNKSVNLYFYHNYDTTIQFKLTKELAKGNHTLDIPNLFPQNSEFERLVNYKTPSNTVKLRVLLIITAGFLALFSFVFGISLLGRKKTKSVSLKTVILISAINFLLIAYIFILTTNKEIFYFDAPYKHYSSNIISASSYIPFMLILLIVPFTYYTVNKIKSNKTKSWIKPMLISNNVVYLILIAGFTYWGLYNFWS